jgi:hypothetical protein
MRRANRSPHVTAGGRTSSGPGDDLTRPDTSRRV